MISLFKKAWVLELIGIIVVSVLIWFIGPLIAIAGKVLLDSEASRIVAIAILFGFWLLYRLLIWVFANKRDRELIRDLHLGRQVADLMLGRCQRSALLRVLRREGLRGAVFVNCVTAKSATKNYYSGNTSHSFVGHALGE